MACDAHEAALLPDTIAGLVVVALCFVLALGFIHLFDLIDEYRSSRHDDIG